MWENDTAAPASATSERTATTECSFPDSTKAVERSRRRSPLLRRRGAWISAPADHCATASVGVALAQYACVACAVFALAGCGSSSVELLSAPTAARCGLTTTVPAAAFPP